MRFVSGVVQLVNNTAGADTSYSALTATTGDRFAVAIRGDKVWLGFIDASDSNTTTWLEPGNTTGSTADEPALDTNHTHQDTDAEFLLLV